MWPSLQAGVPRDPCSSNLPATRLCPQLRIPERTGYQTLAPSPAPGLSNANLLSFLGSDDCPRNTQPPGASEAILNVSSLGKK